MPNTCGNRVQILLIDGSKKCVQLSTVCATVSLNDTRQWIITHLFPYLFTDIHTALSTVNMAKNTTVNNKIIPTIHSTYYYYNQFKKGIIY